MKRAPKPTRRLRKTIAAHVQRGRETLRSRWGRLALEAAWSLQMEATPAAAGINVLDGCEPSNAEQQRAADMIHARVLDMLEAVGRTHFGSSPIEVERAEIVARQGASFLASVAATGEPARKAALRIASVLVALLVFLGAASPGKMAPVRSHKIHAVNFLARARRAFEDVLCKWFSVGWGRRFTGGSRQSAKAGRSRACATWIGKGSARRWSSGSTRARTTSMRSSGSASRSSPLDARAEKSNALPLRSGRVLRCSAARTPEEWALYRLRVQNVLLELQVEPAAVTP